MENDVKFNSICQCCLADDVPMKNMLTELYQDVKLIDNFKICSGIDLLEISKAEDIITSKNICQKCESNLSISIEFRELCHTSQKMLQDRLSSIGVVKEEPISDDEPLVLYTKTGSKRSSIMLTQVFVRRQSDSDSKVTASSLKIEELEENIAEAVIMPQVQEAPVPNDDVDDDFFDNDDFCAGQGSDDESLPPKITDPEDKENVKEEKTTEIIAENEEISTMPTLLMCYHCDEILLTLKDLLIHRKNHAVLVNLSAKIQRKCFVCHEEVTNYTLHLREQHKDFKPHTCKQCERTFSTQHYLKIHLYRHMKTKPYKCLSCGSLHNSKLTLHHHIATVQHSQWLYHCLDCGLGFKAFRLLNEHYHQKHKNGLKKLFPCYHCKRVLRSKDAAHGHECDLPPLDLKRKRPTKTLDVKCPQCKKVFSNDDEMTCHKFTFCEPVHIEAVPKQPKTLNCSQCDEQFANKEAMEQHKSTVCKKSFGCLASDCAKRFKERAYRNRHFKRQHTNYKRVVEKGICDICGTVLAHKYLDRHKKEQHDPNYARTKEIKCFNCTEPGCGKVLHSKHAFEMHVNILHAERRKYYECSLCPKKFCTLLSIRSHVVEHTSDPGAALLMACDFCDKKFVDQKRLNLHRRNHTISNVPVKCDQCPKIFQRVEFLVRHKKSIHEGVYFECCYCQHRFMGETALKCHMFEHRGFRPFNCMACPAEFVRRHVFAEHLKKQHGIVFDQKSHGYEEQEDQQELLKTCKRLGKMPDYTSQPQRKRFKLDSTPTR